MAPIVKLDDIWTDGPPLRLTQLARVSGQSIDTLRRDRDQGYLKTCKRPHRTTSPDLVSRDEARRWLTAIGLGPRASA